MSSIAENAAARRREKLELIQIQIDSGSLTVRKMTAQERRLNPPRPSKSRRNYRPA
jgi:hypothetical protein